MTDRIIAVTGATGQQGSKVARRLLAQGWKVRALTRDANKPAARELAASGAEIMPGDLDKRAELDAAFADAYGVFSVQNYWLPDVGFEGEIRQGKNVADAARDAKIYHLVYSSVGAADRGMGQKHFESKWQIEQYIQSLHLVYTFLRPVFFMENFNRMRPAILNGTYPGMALPPGKTMQMVATDDIGVFAEMAFASAAQYMNKTLELAGDELTEEQIAVTFSRVIGRPVQVAGPQNSSGSAPNPEQQAMVNFFHGKAYDADIPALRALYPGLLTLESYLCSSGWEHAQPEPVTENSAWR